MWSRNVPSDQDVSSDSRAREFKSKIQTITFLESHNKCIIQFHSIQISITEVLARYNNDNVYVYVDFDDNNNNNNNNNNVELKLRQMAIP